MPSRLYAYDRRSFLPVLYVLFTPRHTADMLLIPIIRREKRKPSAPPPLLAPRNGKHFYRKFVPTISPEIRSHLALHSPDGFTDIIYLPFLPIVLFTEIFRRTFLPMIFTDCSYRTFLPTIFNPSVIKNLKQKKPTLSETTPAPPSPSPVTLQSRGGNAGEGLS